MGEVIRPTMDSRLHIMIANTSKLDRIRYRETQKTERERQFTFLKTKPLPMVKPSLTRAKDSKCGKCVVELRAFTKIDDWFMEPIDALTMKTYAKGWFNRMQLCFYSLRKILSYSMTSLVIHPAQIKMMKNIQLYHPEIPLVLVLKSKNPQWDLLLVNFVLYANDIKLTAVDKQLQDSQLTLVDRIQKEMNFIFLDKDEKIGDAQIESQLQAKRNIFILLDDDDERNLQTVLASSTDVFFLPVSINSEKIQKDFKLKMFDGNNLGIVKINFHEPYTIRDLLRSTEMSFPLQRADSVMTISKHLHYDISMKRPVMSTNVVAFLLMTEFRDGASVTDLACKLDALRNINCSIDFAFEGDAEDIVQHAIDILSEHFIDTKKDHIKPKESSMVQLSEYASVLFPHFVMQSILIVSAQSLKRSEGFVDFNTLLTTSSALCELLQCEINFAKPCMDFVEQLRCAFELCSLQGIMHKPIVEPLTSNEQRAHRIARQFEEEGSPSDDDDDGYQSRNANNEVTINDEEMAKTIDALANVTLPIIDAYLTVAYCLKEFIGRKRFTEQEFIKKSSKMMREELEDGNCKFYESCSEGFVASALKCFELSKMIEVDRSGDDNLININSDFDNSKSIKFLIKEINRFV